MNYESVSRMSKAMLDALLDEVERIDEDIANAEVGLAFVIAYESVFMTRLERLFGVDFEKLINEHQEVLERNDD